jgi:hypothetical protein
VVALSTMAVVPFIPMGITVGRVRYRGVRRAAGLWASSGDRSPSLAALKVGRAAGAGGRRRPKRAAAGSAVRWVGDAMIRAPVCGVKRPRRGGSGMGPVGTGTVRLGCVRSGRGGTTGNSGFLTQGRRRPARKRRFSPQSLPAGRDCPLQVLPRRPLRLQEGLSGRGERRLVEQAQRQVADLDAEERRLQTGPRASRTVAAGVPAAWTTMPHLPLLERDGPSLDTRIAAGDRRNRNRSQSSPGRRPC